MRVMTLYKQGQKRTKQKLNFNPRKKPPSWSDSCVVRRAAPLRLRIWE